MVSSVYGDFGDGLLLPTLLMIFIGFTVYKYIYIYVFGDLRVLWGYTEDFGGFYEDFAGWVCLGS